MVTTQERVAARAVCRALVAVALEQCLQGNLEPALGNARKAADLAVAKLSPEEDVIAQCHDTVWYVCTCINRLDEAEQAAAAARKIRDINRWNPRHPNRVRQVHPLESAFNVASDLREMHRYEPAAKLLEHVVALIASDDSIEEHDRMLALLFLADCQYHLDHFSEAEISCDRAVVLRPDSDAALSTVWLLGSEIIERIFLKVHREREAKYWGSLEGSYWNQNGR